MSTSFLSKFFLPLGACLFCLLLATCKQEAENPKEGEASAAAEVPLTPEEQALNETLAADKIFEEAPEDPVPVAEPFVLNKTQQVSILCYHDFTTNRSKVSQMVLHVDDFEKQMEALATAEIPVISMSDFLLWREGQKNIPDPCVVITIDDGWRAVYDLAKPILEKYRYPYTIYLYTKYIDIGGRSMTTAEIKEIMANGGEIGSHSISHMDMTRGGGRKGAAYDAWLQDEIVESGKTLEAKFGVKPKTFAYPYGAYNDNVAEKTIEGGYDLAVTVNGKKATWEDPIGEVGRFVIHGNSNGNFRISTTFRGRGNAGDNTLLSPSAENPDDQLVTVYPPPEETIPDRLPVISVDVSRLGPIEPDSISMRVAGFGEVVPEYLDQQGIVQFKVPARLRNEECFVQVTLRQRDGEKPVVIPWKFFINPDALYLKPPQESETTPVRAGTETASAG